MHLEAYIAYLEEWLEEQLVARKADGFIFGVSGGIDSAVVTKLVARKFRKRSYGVILPCESNPQDVVDATLVLKDAAIEHEIIDLSADRALMLKHSSQHTLGIPTEKLRVIDGNVRARLRMVTLFTIAQAKNYLVIGTDNAAEWITGYFTKYGDGAADIVPLIHLHKSEVYKLAETLDVPEEIIQKTPSAGLWEAQTDEDEIGTTYEMIERYLRGEKIPAKDLEIINFWKDRSDHKREMPIAPRPFKA